MTLINDLKNISKDLEGNVLTIGLDFQTVNNVIDKNKKISNLYMMSFNGKKKSKTKEKGKKNKTISIKKIRKVFKKKRIDYIICNIEDINRFLRTFIRDSVFIGKTKLFIYGNTENFDVDLITERYKRYDVNIVQTEYDKDKLLEIDLSKATNNKIKDFIYNLEDIGYSIINTIGDILIS